MQTYRWLVRVDSFYNDRHTHVPPGDNSFIETSSGAAARELKRRFDQYLGVGKDVRSPYAITAFVNQHGKQMYRIGCVPLPYAQQSGEADC